MKIKWLHGKNKPFSWLGIYIWRFQFAFFIWRYGFFDKSYGEGRHLNFSFLWRSETSTRIYRQLLCAGIRRRRPYFELGDDFSAARMSTKQEWGYDDTGSDEGD